jgi:hypothetical protein
MGKDGGDDGVSRVIIPNLVVDAFQAVAAVFQAVEGIPVAVSLEGGIPAVDIPVADIPVAECPAAECPVADIPAVDFQGGVVFLVAEDLAVAGRGKNAWRAFSNN